MTSTLTPEQLLENLQRFTGSDQFIQHPVSRSVVYTEGVHYLAEETGAFCLVDAIASYFGSDEMRAELKADHRLKTFQVWTLYVEGSTASLVMAADKGEAPAICQEIAYTDFPLTEIDIWAGFNGLGWTLYLPSEH